VPDAQLLLRAPFEPQAARAAIDGFCGTRQDFDGVVACSDLLAIQAMQSLRSAGRKVPANVAVVGYDDMPLAAYCDPPLTTIHQPVDQAGAALVDALLRMLGGEKVSPITLAVNRVVRDSAP
jgi:DNA-binding LacI/PurR family transcriptional regulator